MHPPLQLPDSVTGFDYYRLTPEADAVAGAFGYSFRYADVQLPRVGDALPWASDLRETLSLLRFRIRLTSETARRQFLIAPVLTELAERYDILLRADFTLHVSDQLRGNLDYLVQSPTPFPITSVQDGDDARATSEQVATKIAVDRWVDADEPILYGAISTGTLWQFTALHRQEKRFEQDRKIFLVPDDLPDLCTIQLGISTLR